MRQGDTLSLNGIEYEARYVNEVLIIDEFKDLRLAMQMLVPQTLDEFIISSMTDEHLSKVAQQFTKELTKRGINPILKVIGDLHGYSLHINEQVSELQGMDCRSNERRSYYEGVQYCLEIALQELNKLT